MKCVWIPLVVYNLCVLSVYGEEPSTQRTPSGIVISKETTFVTGPLDADGYVDYTTVLNRKASQGVTPENNSVVLLERAFGPEATPEYQREKFYELLGMPVLPEKGDYLVTFEMMYPDASDELRDQLRAAWFHPWSQKDSPFLMKWLTANEIPLKRATEAVRRPEYFAPYLTYDWNGDSLALGLNLSVTAHRELMRLFMVRVMHSIHEGRTDDAIADLLTVRRLGRHLQNGMTVIEHLVGQAIESNAIHGEQVLLAQGKLTSAQIQAYARQVQQLPTAQRVEEIINFGHRLQFLEVVQSLSRQGNGFLHQLQLLREVHLLEPEGVVPMALLLKLMRIDWEIVMRTGNRRYDQALEASREPTFALQQIAWDYLNRELEGLGRNAFDDGEGLLKQLLKKVAWRKSLQAGFSERVGDFLISLNVSSIEGALAAQHRHDQTQQLNRVSFALAAYKADHKSYPQSLTDLQPQYLRKIPTDFYSQKPICYRTTHDGYLLYSVFENQKDDRGYVRLGLSDGDLVLPMPPVEH